MRYISTSSDKINKKLLIVRAQFFKRNTYDYKCTGAKNVNLTIIDSWCYLSTYLVILRCDYYAVRSATFDAESVRIKGLNLEEMFRFH
jgi:hypothetical protein